MQLALSHLPVGKREPGLLVLETTPPSDMTQSLVRPSLPALLLPLLLFLCVKKEDNCYMSVRFSGISLLVERELSSITTGLGSHPADSFLMDMALEKVYGKVGSHSRGPSE